jgi:hypothetical protein
MLYALPANAVHKDGYFELDANTTASAATAGDDWSTLYANRQSPGSGGATADGFAGFGFVNDKTGTGGDVTYWTGGGSKDRNDISQWEFTTNDQSPDKNDIVNAMSAIYKSSTGPRNLYFGADRFAVNGDAQMGFWFLVKPVCLAGTAISATKNCPNTNPGKVVNVSDGTIAHHSSGDVLVLVNFNNGGVIGLAGVYQWSTALGQPVQVNVSTTGGLDCTLTTNNTDDFCSTSNKVDLGTGEPPWPYNAKNVSGQATYNQSAFIEGGIDLGAIEGAGKCFPTFLAETRSSSGPSTGLSLDAQLKDLALGSFELCGATISIGPDDVNEVGDPHTFTVTVNQRFGSDSTPVVGNKPTVTLTDNNGATVSPTGGTCSSTGTNAQGQCTVTFSSNTARVITGHASTTVTIDGTSFDVATDGANGNSGDAVKQYVDAQIDLSPLNDTNEVNDPHTITATVQKDDGKKVGATGGDGVDGFAPAPNGTVVTFSLPAADNTAGAAFTPAGANTCTISNGLGTCSVQINTTTAGAVKIHATTTFAVGGLSLTRASDGQGNNSADANKVYVDANITIGPDDVNGIGESHTFTVTVKKDVGDGAGLVPVSGLNPAVTLSPAASVAAGSVNTCASTGTNAQGQCTITFTSNTAGSIVGNASVTVPITVGGVLVNVTRDTDPATGTTSSGPGGTGPATKQFKSGTLRWLKHDQDGNLLGGATFRVCRTHTWNSTTSSMDDTTDVCINSGGTPPNVLDNGAFDEDATAGEFQISGLVLGRYTIVETIAPAGYDKDTDAETVDLTLSNPSNADATAGDVVPVFVDVRLFKMIVITCNQATNQLVASTVTLGGSAKDTITSVPGSLPAGTTQANVCNIGGAAYGDLHADTYNPSVQIPKP